MVRVEKPFPVDPPGLFSSFSKSDAWAQIQREAEQEVATLRPSEAGEFEKSFSGRVFEELASSWLDLEVRRYRLLTPMETLLWTRERFPTSEMSYEYLQQSLMGISVFDGLIVRPDRRGEEIVVAFCEYGLNGTRNRHEFKRRAFLTQKQLPGVSQNASLVHVIPDEPAVEAIINRVAPFAIVDKMPFTRQEFTTLRRAHGIISPLETATALVV